MMTTEEITKAVNDAGFADAAELTTWMQAGRAVLQRQTLTYAIAAKQAESQAATQATQAEIQKLQQQISAIDAQLTQG